MMTLKGIMIQGTSSDVGKSYLTTAICRILHKQGHKVTPFKSQNMSNNSYVTLDGKEIGRAQGIQAEAAGIEANVYMNPILLKPRNDLHSEVIFLGSSYRTFSGKEYREHFFHKGFEVIKQSLKVLEQSFDYVVIEGAGSPVEINLNDRELVNMRVAKLANVPVVLVADIERGGVFASIVGTLQLLSEQEREQVVGIIINKFRGDPDLFTDGVQWIEQYTGKKVLGVIPHLPNIYIDGEDSLSWKEKKGKDNGIDLAVVKLPYVSNYTDLDPFQYEEDVSVRFIQHADEFGSPDALILPGTRSTISDLSFLKDSKLIDCIRDYHKAGGTIMGVCGGYQLLGEKLYDTSGFDSGIEGTEEEGIGILPITTQFFEKKKTIRVEGTLGKETPFSTIRIEGYEIHTGISSPMYSDQFVPFALMENHLEGICSIDGRLIGTYIHHIFHNDLFRTKWLNTIRVEKGLSPHKVNVVRDRKEAMFDSLAKEVEKALDIPLLINLIDQWGVSYAK
jgi:adenosylcobyric acid synthase